MRSSSQTGVAISRITGIEKSTTRPSGALLVSFWIFGLSQKIIDGDIVEVCKLNQHIGGDVPLAEFVIAVGSLRTIKIFCKFPLL